MMFRKAASLSFACLMMVGIGLANAVTVDGLQFDSCDDSKQFCKKRGLVWSPHPDKGRWFAFFPDKRISHRIWIWDTERYRSHLVAIQFNCSNSTQRMVYFAQYSRPFLQGKSQELPSHLLPQDETPLVPGSIYDAIAGVVCGKQ